MGGGCPVNALEIIERVRDHQADLIIVDDRLVVRGRAERLPEGLQAELREHKAELMIALGAPIDRTVAAILKELRPHLPPPLRRLPDDKILALVNWSIIAAWGTAVRKAGG
jgi:hypothetical protein